MWLKASSLNGAVKSYLSFYNTYVCALLIVLRNVILKDLYKTMMISVKVNKIKD